jgi:DNA polymerase-1
VANAGAIKGVVGENLKKSLDWLPIGRSLLTIKTDCNLDGWVPDLPAMDSIATGEQDTSALAVFYNKYGFKGLARALGASAAVPASEAITPARREPDLFDEPDLSSAPVVLGAAVASSGERCDV